MSETLDPTLAGLGDCGCCAGLTAETPATLRNREGLDRIEYRAGTHPQFLRTMLAALSEARRAPLHALTTRSDDDFTIALLDAWATTADVLTFYQERFAQESFLRTATEHGSVLRLARLIGYELQPGVAASTWLAFQLETAPGAPEQALIARGTKVQSVPGQEEKPQVFETGEPLEARAEWNALRPQMAAPRLPQAGDDHLFLKGTATVLQPGDAILIVGHERDQHPAVHPDKERWDVRILTQVEVNVDKDWTRIAWEHGLGRGAVAPAAENVRVYAFRQRAALFGHNAPDPALITKPGGAAVGTWTDFKIRNGLIDLDANYGKVVAGGWLALARPPDEDFERGYVELYKASRVSFPSRAEFAIASKVTRIRPDTEEHLADNFFPLRDTIVYAQSELLALGATPVAAPVEGASITLDRQITPLPKGRTLIVTGRRIPAAAGAALSSERVVVESVTGNPSTILLAGAGLAHRYERATVTISGNVAAATHGETVEEYAGSGDATRTFQKFTLRQSPLTHVRAGTASGLASTLEVRVDDLLWRAAPSLYQRGADERVYVARLGDEEKTTIHFGDGVSGARLPSGQQNVRLRYRKGGGLAGMVRAGQLSQLLTRPLGVRDVTNPLPAEGADEAESLADARRNAPLTVRTLERAVSLQDYEDFARAYPGITKALATWTWDGRSRSVLLTVAGTGGAPIAAGDAAVTGLLDSLRAAGDPFVPVRVRGYRLAEFELAATVRVHPDHETEPVLARVRAALRAGFAFERREFGQPVMLSEVIAVLHSVAGVVAVNVDHLQRTDRTEPVDPAPRLLAEFPAAGAEADVQPAELLLLAPGGLDIITAAP